jgi:hypothetical protein
MQSESAPRTIAATRIHADVDQNNRPVLWLHEEAEQFRLLSPGATSKEVTRLAFELVAAAREFLLFAGQYESARTLPRPARASNGY